MPGDKINVCLIGPAKIGARWLRQGEQGVTADEKLALEEAGMLVPDDLAAALIAASGSPQLAIPTGTEITFDQEAFNAAVSAEAIKLARQAFDGELDKMEAELKDIAELGEKEKADLRTLLEETSRLLANERQKSADLAEKLTAADAELTALKVAQPVIQAQTDTPPSEKVAKTAPKKAAATAPKG